MRARILATAAVDAVAVATTALAVAPAGASVTYYYFGYAGGSLIRALKPTAQLPVGAEIQLASASAGAA